jgi:DNA mismatch repair protein MSH3
MVTSSGLKLASQPKKQQSISSFFTPKTAATAAAPSINAKPSGTGSLHPGISNGDGNRGDCRDGGGSTPSSSRRVSTKRALEDEEVTGTDMGASSCPKRHRRRDSTPRSVDQNDEQRNLPTPPSVSDGRPGRQISGRTSKYLFTGSSQSTASGGGADLANENTDPVAQRQKERLHQKFVKKLGNPDSIAEIKRRRWQNPEAAECDSDSAEFAEGEEDKGSAMPGPNKARGSRDAKKASASKKSNLTPMEKQFLEIKRKHMDTLLVMEVGYKFRFLGEDARAASETLKIMCIPGKFRYDERECSPLFGCPPEEHHVLTSSKTLPKPI